MIIASKSHKMNLKIPIIADLVCTFKQPQQGDTEKWDLSCQLDYFLFKNLAKLRREMS